MEESIKWDDLLPLFSEDKKTKELKAKIKEATMEALFNQEEQFILREQLPKMEDNPQQLTKWINVIKRVEHCLADKKTANSKEAILIAEDIILLSNETFNGNEELANKFWEARKSEELSKNLNLYPVRQEVLLFIEEAIANFEFMNPKI